MELPDETLHAWNLISQPLLLSALQAGLSSDEQLRKRMELACMAALKSSPSPSMEDARRLAEATVKRDASTVNLEKFYSDSKFPDPDKSIRYGCAEITYLFDGAVTGLLQKMLTEAKIFLQNDDAMEPAYCRLTEYCLVWAGVDSAGGALTTKLVTRLRRSFKRGLVTSAADDALLQKVISSNFVDKALHRGNRGIQQVLAKSLKDYRDTVLERQEVALPLARVGPLEKRSRECTASSAKKSRKYT